MVFKRLPVLTKGQQDMAGGQSRSASGDRDAVGGRPITAEHGKSGSATVVKGSRGGSFSASDRSGVTGRFVTTKDGVFRTARMPDGRSVTIIDPAVRARAAGQADTKIAEVRARLRKGTSHNNKR